MIRSLGPDLSRRRDGAWGGGFEFQGALGSWAREPGSFTAPRPRPLHWRHACSMPRPIPAADQILTGMVMVPFSVQRQWRIILGF